MQFLFRSHGGDALQFFFFFTLKGGFITRVFLLCAAVGIFEGNLKEMISYRLS